MIDHKTLSEGRERSFIHFQWASVEIDVDFRQLHVRQNGRTGRVIPLNWRAV